MDFNRKNLNSGNSVIDDESVACLNLAEVPLRTIRENFD
jgi:hypothetical protein